MGQLHSVPHNQQWKPHNRLRDIHTSMPPQSVLQARAEITLHTVTPLPLTRSTEFRTLRPYVLLQGDGLPTVPGLRRLSSERRSRRKARALSRKTPESPEPLLLHPATTTTTTNQKTCIDGRTEVFCAIRTRLLCLVPKEEVTDSKKRGGHLVLFHSESFGEPNEHLSPRSASGSTQKSLATTWSKSG